MRQHAFDDAGSANPRKVSPMFTASIFSYKRRMYFLSCMAVLTCLLLPMPMRAQSTVATGSIQGTVTDPNDAVVANATITITNVATGEVKKVTSTSAGTFASGALIPGDYEVRIEASGFQTVLTKIAVQVGVIATGNTRLAVGKTSEIVEVAGSAVQVNTEQATVQGVLTETLERVTRQAGSRPKKMPDNRVVPTAKASSVKSSFAVRP